MDINYLKSLPEGERKELLEADAMSIEETRYTKPLNDAEVAFYKNQLAEQSIQQATILEEKKKAMDDFKTRLIPVSAKITEALQAVKFRSVDFVGLVYSPC